MTATAKTVTQARLRKEEAERAASSPVRLISIADIHVGERLRALDTDEVDKLAGSMKELGQLAPIVVRKTPRSDTAYALVAGLHSLQAAQKLGQDQIQAAIHEPMEPAAAQMAEIAENLVRFDLSTSKRMKHTERWKELYEAAHPETKPGATGRGRGKSSQDENSNGHPSATKHIAKSTGRGKSSVARDAAIAKKLGERLDRINGTSLDTGAETAALAKLSEAEQEALVARAAAGETVSAKAELAAMKSRAKSEPAGAPVTGSIERPIEETPADEPPSTNGHTKPDDGHSVLAVTLKALMNEALAHCETEHNWQGLRATKEQRDDATKALRDLRDLLVKIAAPKAVH